MSNERNWDAEPNAFVIWTARAAVIALAILGMIMFFTAVAKSEVAPPVTFVDRLVALQPSFANKKDPPVDAREFAEAVDAVAKGNRQWAALITTLAIHEGGLSDRIRRGEYTRHEGDSFVDKNGDVQHKAWGLLQVHRSSLNADVFGSLEIRDQIREGSRIARGMFYMCKTAGVPFPLGVFRAMGGHGCHVTLKGEQARVATFNRVLARL